MQNLALSALAENYLLGGFWGFFFVLFCFFIWKRIVELWYVNVIQSPVTL